MAVPLDPAPRLSQTHRVTPSSLSHCGSRATSSSNIWRTHQVCHGGLRPLRATRVPCRSNCQIRHAWQHARTPRPYSHYCLWHFRCVSCDLPWTGHWLVSGWSGLHIDLSRKDQVTFHGSQEPSNATFSTWMRSKSYSYESPYGGCVASLQLLGFLPEWCLGATAARSARRYVVRKLVS
jgi:hypothetical protein